VGKLEGSEAAKARLRAILEALAGRRTVAEVCRWLGVSERRYHALRRRALQGALRGLEPRPAGRRVAALSAGDARVGALEAEVRQLRLDLRAAQIREEIALVMPQLLRRGGRAKKAVPRAGRGHKTAARSGARGGCGP
jgi:hypothetical protein